MLVSVLDFESTVQYVYTKIVLLLLLCLANILIELAIVGGACVAARQMQMVLPLTPCPSTIHNANVTYNTKHCELRHTLYMHVCVHMYY